MPLRKAEGPGAVPRGFSLVEVMIVLVVLSVGIMALARVFPTSARNMVSDRLRTEAVYFAQQKVETLRSEQGNSPDLAAGRHPSGSATEALKSNGVLQRYWTVAALGAPLDNTLRVDVVVRWNGPTRADSVVSTSYVNH